MSYGGERSVVALLQEMLEQKPQSSAANNMRHFLQFPMVMMEPPPPSPDACRIKWVSCSSPQQVAVTNTALTAPSVSLIQQPILRHCIRRALILLLLSLSALLKITKPVQAQLAFNVPKVSPFHNSTTDINIPSPRKLAIGPCTAPAEWRLQPVTYLFKIRFNIIYIYKYQVQVLHHTESIPPPSVLIVYECLMIQLSINNNLFQGH
jgi:hypothetical protein